MERLTTFTRKCAFFKIEIIFFHALYYVKYGIKFVDVAIILHALGAGERIWCVPGDLLSNAIRFYYDITLSLYYAACTY